MTMLEITLKKGLVGKSETQRKIVAALGLTKYGSSAKHSNNASICGMVDKVQHLVTVTEIAESGKAKEATKKTEVKAKKVKRY